ncbi:MAG: hypothetical protein ABIP16_07825 [Thermomonas sp.]
MVTISPRINLPHLASRHLIGLFATSQAMVAVMLHATWIFLLLAGLLMADAGEGSQSATGSLGNMLMRALEWIGAVERDGRNTHGDLGTVMRALVTLSPVIYLGQLLIDHLRRGRPPWSMARKTLLSMAVATCGYTASFALLPDDARAGLWVMGVVAVLLIGLATLWALLVRKGCDAFLRRLSLATD